MLQTLGGVVGKSSLKMIWPWTRGIRILSLVVGKRSCLVKPSLPGGSLLARDAVLPEHEVHGAICILHWPGGQFLLNCFHHRWNTLLLIGRPGNESKGMILPPAFSLLREPGLGNSRHFVSTTLPLKLVSHLIIWNWKMNAVWNAQIRIHVWRVAALQNWGFRGEKETYSPRN